MELLLGLGSPAIDQQLVKQLHKMAERETWGRAGLADALSERGPRRWSLVVERTSKPLVLAWATPTLPVLQTWVGELELSGVWGQPAVFAALVDLFFSNHHPLPGSLRCPGSPRWLVRQFQQDPPVTAPAAWVPQVSPALLRDELTGLLSRNSLDENPHRLRLAAAPQWQMPCEAVLYVDVDRMRFLNERFGYRTVDAVLIAIAEALQATVGDRVVRFGGDELLIPCEPDEAEALAELALDTIRQLRVHHEDAPGDEVRVTVSIGISAERDALNLLSSAEDALQLAKERGRDRIEWAPGPE